MPFGRKSLELIAQAGLIVKGVLLLLVLFSVGSWGIIFYKAKQLASARRESDRFLEFFWAKRRFDLVWQELKEFGETPLATLFHDAYQELTNLQRLAAKEGIAEATLVAECRDNLGRALRRASTNETHRLERFMTFLATTASATPFIGLFGTVWGIMDSFQEIGKAGNASLAVVAPGISEALVATAIGLAAAIPAVIAYNHFLSKVNLLIDEMDNFGKDFLNIVARMERRP